MSDMGRGEEPSLPSRVPGRKEHCPLFAEPQNRSTVWASRQVLGGGRGGGGYWGTLGRINLLGVLGTDWQRSGRWGNNRTHDPRLKKPLGRENRGLNSTALLRELLCDFRFCRPLSFPVLETQSLVRKGHSWRQIGSSFPWSALFSALRYPSLASPLVKNLSLDEHGFLISTIYT